MAVISDVTHPRTCAGCGREDTLWCPDCAALFAVPPTPRCPPELVAAAGCDLLSFQVYAGCARQFVLAAKHDRRRDVQPVLTQCGVIAGRALAERGYRPRWVVPAPSSLKRRWRRHLVAHLIADGVAKGLAESGVRPIACVDALRLAWNARTQAGRSGAQRAAARSGAMRALVDLPGEVVLVDDVVTTGATVAEAVRVLREGGSNVQVALSLTVAERPGSHDIAGRNPVYPRSHAAKIKATALPISAHEKRRR
ncbi:MAG: competence protein ComF [Actinomycetaceae bacterium]|nr:competence protein ComF [Actinomycetaceae bacterium]MDU0969699.1 competence protein ComF [Actinomycetaceae bacterium]